MQKFPKIKDIIDSTRAKNPKLTQNVENVCKITTHGFNKAYKKIRKAIRFLLTLGAIFFIMSFISSLIPKSLPEKMILVIDLNNKITETPVTSLLKTYKGATTLGNVIRSIENGANDDRVKALLIKCGDARLGMAQIEELRNSIKKFNEKGKRSIFFANSFGQAFSNGTDEYYLATAASEIWLQNSGVLNLFGISSEKPYIRKTLDKVGVKPISSARKEYKNGYDMYKRSSASKYEKENLTSIMSNLYNDIVNSVSKDRKIKSQKIKELINNAPIYPKKAYDVGLVDRLGYIHELEEELDRDTKSASYINVEDYRFTPSKAKAKQVDKKIALIYFNGVITADTKDESHVSAKDMVKLLKKLGKDKDINTVLLRVNSPGGSYIASDEIYKAVMWLKEVKKKPVIVSMGDYAASGGYFIAMAGDKIFANKNSLTGSIGVFSGKMIGQDKLWKELGISWQRYNFGNNSGMASFSKDFSVNQKKAFEKSLDIIYNDFTGKVAKSRKMYAKNVEKVSKGRVWTGSQAVKNGLADELGGMKEAMLHTKNVMGLNPTDLVNIEIYPKSKGTISQITDMLDYGVFYNKGKVSMLEIIFGEKYIEIGSWIEDSFKSENTVLMEPVYINR